MKVNATTSTSLHWIGILVIVALWRPALSQDTFVAITPEEVPQYRFNLSRYFFPSLEAEKRERTNLLTTLKELEAFKGKVALSPDNLLRVLELSDSLQVQFHKHSDYLYLRWAINTQDGESLKEGKAIGAEVAKRTSFVHKELKGITDRTLTECIAQKPQLEIYRFVIEQETRYDAHAMPLAEQELTHDLAPFITDWQYTLHEDLLARTQYGTVHTSEGDLDVYKQRTVIDNHPDRTVREAAFKKLYNGFASQRDLQAFVLVRLASARNHLARLHHYEDAASESYFHRYWTKTEISDLLERVEKQADIYKRYQHIRANYVKKISGYQTINIWDMSVRPVGSPSPRFTIDQARNTIHEALKPLGPMYELELTQLLDPANGRLDIVPGDNRRSGGFSSGFVGETSTFFSSSFAGSYNEARILAHESTHAVQRQLMNNNGVLPVYFGGPLWESFAMFSELLWADYLSQNEADPIRKQYFQEQFFEGKGMIMFVAGPEAVLEQAVYEGVKRGEINNADDLDTLTKRVYSQFSIWPQKHEELKSQWIDIPLMYEDPFYDLNYVYGGALALKYYQLYLLSPKKFVRDYIALMANGSNARPDILLKKFLDIDLHDPRLVSDAVSVLEAKLKLLEAGYSN